MSNKEYWESEMKRLYDATPDKQKKGAQFWMSLNIASDMGFPETYLGLPVMSSPLLEPYQAVIGNMFWNETIE